MIDLEPTVACVRGDFEAGRVDARLLADLYRGYAPVPDPETFVSEAVQMFPALCCGLASVYLQFLLGAGAIVRGRFGRSNHTVLEIPEQGLIIDITADQFGGPAVYVGPWREPWARPLRTRPCT